MKNYFVLISLLFLGVSYAENTNYLEIDSFPEFFKNLNFQEDPIYKTADDNPEYKEGLARMYKFIGENLKYPKAAMEAKIEGRSIIRFVVEKDGSLSNITIWKGAGYGMDLEAMRIIALMPAWIPAKIKNVPVRSYYTMPIIFKLDRK